MKKAIAAILAVSIAGTMLAGIGRTDLLTVDLNRKSTPYKWTWTEITANAVRITAMRDGEEYPTEGWTGALFMGNGVRGMTFTGVATNYCTILFDIPIDTMPTNGTYASQILCTHADGRTEEWARGTIVVNINPAVSALPDGWSLYEDLAGKVNTATLAALLEIDSNVNALTNKLAEVGYSAGAGGGAGGGDVASVNGKTGVVVVASADIPHGSTTVSNALAQTAQQLTAHTSATNPHGITAANIGAATTQALAALSDSISNGVPRALTYGTETRWTDATGCVWSAEMTDNWTITHTPNTGQYPETFLLEWINEVDEYYYPRVGWYAVSSLSTPELLSEDPHATELHYSFRSWDPFPDGVTYNTTMTRNFTTNLVGNVALRSDIVQTANFLKDLHADTATNVVWRNVYSNGWVFIQAYTNDLSVVNGTGNR